MAKDNEQNSAKTHYKMYKAGKKWMFAGLTMVSMIAGSAAVATDTGDLKTGVAEFADDAMEAVSNVVSLGSASADTASAATQLVAGSSQSVTDGNVTIADGASADDYFSLTRAAGQSTALTNGAANIVDGESQNGNIVMKNQFDMTQAVTLSGTQVVGSAQNHTAGNYQGPGDGLGVVLAGVDPSSIASGTTGNSNMQMGIVGLGTNAIFMGWDMFMDGNSNPSGEKASNSASNNSYALAQLNTFTAGSGATTVTAQTGTGNQVALSGGTWDSQTNYRAGQTVNWKYTWTPTGTLASDGTIAGTMTYTLTNASGATLGTISYSATVQQGMSIAYHMSTGWAYSTTNVGVTSGAFKAR